MGAVAKDNSLLAMATRQEDKMVQGIITGYTLYVNGRVWGIYDSLQQASKEADRYRRHNDIDIYPMWKF